MKYGSARIGQRVKSNGGMKMSMPTGTPGIIKKRWVAGPTKSDAARGIKGYEQVEVEFEGYGRKALHPSNIDPA